jgi:hypothetical protein
VVGHYYYRRKQTKNVAKKTTIIKYYNCAGFDDASQNCPPSDLFFHRLKGYFGQLLHSGWLLLLQAETNKKCGKKTTIIKCYNCAGFDDASQNCPPSELFFHRLKGYFSTFYAILCCCT